MDIMQWVLLSVTAVGALLAALFTLFASNATKSASRGTALLSCLEKYIAIMDDYRKACKDQRIELAQQAYRELFDLHWSEFHLWQAKIIPDRVMQSWLHVRKRNYREDKIECIADNGSHFDVTYKEQWQNLLTRNYFEMGDPFVKFMEKAHAEGEINMKEFIKEFRK